MRIFPLGDNAITIEFGNEISLELNRKALALTEFLDANPFPGFIESLPAYSSTTVFFNIGVVREAFFEFETAFDAVRSIAENAVSKLSERGNISWRNVEIPIHINDEVSIDLEGLSEWSCLTKDEVVEIYLGRTYNVYMIGFLPGFAYMGEVDERIAMPRKQTPRVKVPPGSVAIGGKQTGVYPLQSPGGWHIVGKTEMKMFDPENENLCPLRPGDLVKFIRA